MWPSYPTRQVLVFGRKDKEGFDHHFHQLPCWHQGAGHSPTTWRLNPACALHAACSHAAPLPSHTDRWTLTHSHAYHPSRQPPPSVPPWSHHITSPATQTLPSTHINLVSPFSIQVNQKDFFKANIHPNPKHLYFTSWPGQHLQFPSFTTLLAYCFLFLLSCSQATAHPSLPLFQHGSVHPPAQLDRKCHSHNFHSPKEWTDIKE